mgnify:CR=1 FL=1
MDTLEELETSLKEQSHYTQGDIQPLDFIVSNKLDFREGNVVKYITRWKYKDGLKDLIKCRVYLDDLIEEQGETAL